MSFDIARTPTLHAVATGDEQQLVENLQERVEAALLQAVEVPAVVRENTYGEAKSTYAETCTITLF